ncbi:hypothetical protein XH88_31720 [Bradyrhizobium sp. CCBAU 51627]|nr:hypothetical protein [Bradyrhizobium sp. CCBAU 51627]
MKAVGQSTLLAFQRCLRPKHNSSGTKMRVFYIQPQQILAGESTDRGNNVAARTCTLLEFVDGLRSLLECYRELQPVNQ